MKLKARIEFKLEDFWIGVFWKKTTMVESQMAVGRRLDIWACLVPCVPLHLTLTMPGMWAE